MKDWLRFRFGRVTSSGLYIPQVDGLRLVAILAVIGHHVFAAYLELTHRLGAQQLPRDWAMLYSRSPLVSWALNLALGVPLFCVISGFVLSLPFAANYLKGAPRPSRKVYFLRRLVRLEPPYFLNLIILFAVIVTPWRQSDPLGWFTSYFHAFFPHLLASLAYLHAVIFSQASWINGVAWTLEIEVEFYLLLPLLAELFRIRPTALRRSLVVLLILACALANQFWIVPSGIPLLKLSLPVQLHFFLAGLLLADLYLDPPRIFTSRAQAADALAMLSFVLFIYVVHYRQVLVSMQPFLVMGIYLGVLLGDWVSRPFRLPVVTLLGGMSYTVYLYHSFMVRQLLPFTIRLFPPVHPLWVDFIAQFLLLLLPIFALCAVLFVLTERPFMILSKEVSRRSKSVAASGAAALKAGGVF